LLGTQHLSVRATDPYRMYNLDVFEYELNSPMALYGANTFMLAHSVARSVGLLWLNAAETWVDIGASSIGRRHPAAASSTADKGMLRSLVDKFAASAEVPQVGRRLHPRLHEHADRHAHHERVGPRRLVRLPGPLAQGRDAAERQAHRRRAPPARTSSYLMYMCRVVLQLFSLAYHQCRWNYNDEADVKQVLP